MFNSIRNNKASELIVSQIRKNIFQGKLVPGDRLPAERLLMEQFSVSKQTLREAMRVLEFIGLIEIKKGTGGGACIAEIDNNITMDMLANFLYFKDLSLNNLMEVRKIVEPYAAAVAADNISKEDLAKLKALIDLAEEQYKADDTSEGDFKNDLDFHCVIANSTQNPLLILLVTFIESLVSDKKANVKLDKKFLASVISDHKKIYEAIVKKDATLAGHAMRKHIDKVEKNMQQLEQNPNPLLQEAMYTP